MNSDSKSMLDGCHAEVSLSYSRASGPGGQNVNKVSTAVRLHFDVKLAACLDDAAKQRLVSLAGSRLTGAGVLVLEASRFRSQERNRQDILERFDTLILRAAQRPGIRKTTHPTAASKERRLRAKKRKADLKSLRSGQPE